MIIYQVTRKGGIVTREAKSESDKGFILSDGNRVLKESKAMFFSTNLEEAKKHLEKYPLKRWRTKTLFPQFQKDERKII